MPVVIVRLIPAPGQTQNVLDVFRDLAPLVHQEPGCGLFALHSDGENILLVERWLSAGDLQAHLCSSNFHRIRDALSPLLAAPSAGGERPPRRPRQGCDPVTALSGPSPQSALMR
ncbi:putative quinol monooxygenase [Streptomyces sp. NPDC007205]|uniref:putative quinol monooxygenase n=1 Tax=Streptomyces sp. NPDC007205 TaxID=3154316 RepID=UPI003410B457